MKLTGNTLRNYIHNNKQENNLKVLDTLACHREQAINPEI